MEGVNLFANYAWYFALPVVIVIGVFFLLRPHVRHKNSIPHKKIALVGTMSILAGFIAFNGVLALTDPANMKDTKQSNDIAMVNKEQSRAQKTGSAKPVTTTETKVEPIPFTMLERTDNTMVKGQSRVLTKGVDGQRTITYEVTRVGDQETARREIKNVVTLAAVNQVTVVGTYIPKVAVTDASSKSSSTSSSKPSAPTGATALCKDGTYSFSKTRRTACLTHGGVAKWL